MHKHGISRSKDSKIVRLLLNSAKGWVADVFVPHSNASTMPLGSSASCVHLATMEMPRPEHLRTASPVPAHWPTRRTCGCSCSRPKEELPLGVEGTALAFRQSEGSRVGCGHPMAWPLPPLTQVLPYLWEPGSWWVPLHSLRTWLHWPVLWAVSLHIGRVKGGGLW